MAMSRPSNDTEPNRYFGKQADGSWHWGTDWGWGQGKAVRAMLGGTIVEIRTLSDYGLIVKINHGRDASGAVVETRYCHLASYSSGMKVGDTVFEGQQIGIMGSSGSLTTTVHLHSELWLNNVRQDETKYTFVPAGQPVPPVTDQMGKHMRHLLLYTSANPNLWIEIDFLDRTYAILKDFELEMVANDVKAGRRYDVISDPAWGKNFGNGQYRNVSTPATNPAYDDTKVLAAIGKVPTAEQNGAAARAAIVK